MTPFWRTQLRRSRNSLAIVAIAAVLGHLYAPSVVQIVNTIVWAAIGIALWILFARRNGIEPRTYDSGNDRWAGIRFDWRVNMTHFGVVAGLLLLYFARLLLLPELDESLFTPLIAGGSGATLVYAQKFDIAA